MKTTTHGVVSVIDLTTDKEFAGSTASLHEEVRCATRRRALADDDDPPLPGVPTDIAFVKGGGVAYVAANGADAVFRVVRPLAGERHRRGRRAEQRCSSI